MNKSSIRPSLFTLGTAQLGIPYGIANKSGMPDETRAQEILEAAWQNGIYSFDTATAYGESERRIGTFIENHPERCSSLFIATKGAYRSDNRIPEKQIAEELLSQLEASLKTLKLKTVTLYMIHDFASFRHFRKAYYMFFNEAKKRGYIGYAGLSLYDPEEAEEILDYHTEEPIIEAVQLPYNLFDRRFAEKLLFQRFRSAGFIVFIRSVFLQGLFFLSPVSLSAKLKTAEPYLTALNQISSEYGTSIRRIALGFAKQNADPDSIVIGVESVEQLRENIDAADGELPLELISRIERELTDIPASIRDPRKW
jgi:aryl-alcohol dehydrogenase-like predicted oxidoreductase